MGHKRDDRMAGCIWGLALGDSYGYPVEFLSYKKITKKYGRKGPKFPKQAIVSDDTQMSLAVWNSITRLNLSYPAMIQDLVDEFLIWLDDKDNNRAPGMTCTTALRFIKHGLPWHVASMIDSKGCGAMMRAPWIGVGQTYAGPALEMVAQLQAAITHGHPTAVVTADVTARIVRDLAEDRVTLEELPKHALQLAAETRLHHALEPVALRLGETVTEYQERGVSQLWSCLDFVPIAVDQMRDDPWGYDVCEWTGEGWIAEEALATALLCVALFPDQPLEGLRRAACTGGDSDSVACIVGSLYGAALGDCWPKEWKSRLEKRYHEELTDAVAKGSHL